MTCPYCGREAKPPFCWFCAEKLTPKTDIKKTKPKAIDKKENE